MLRNGDSVKYAGMQDPPGFEAEGTVLEVRSDGSIVVEWEGVLTGPIAHDKSDTVNHISQISPEYRYDDSEAILLIAAQDGQADVVERELISGTDVDAIDSQGSSALIHASSGGYIDIVKLLLERGAEVNLQNTFGYTPLIRAVIGKHEEVVRMLLDKGASTELKERQFGATALMGAVFSGKIGIVNALLEHGAPLNVKGNDQKTAMDYALEEGHDDIVQSLQDHAQRLQENSMEGTPNLKQPRKASHRKNASPTKASQQINEKVNRRWWQFWR